jgi:hypothetical protein
MTPARRSGPVAALAVLAVAAACCLAALAATGAMAMAAADADGTTGQEQSGRAVPGLVRLSAADAHAVRAVVQAQIDAMSTDDDARAFSFASPSVRQQFRDAPSFMLMVRHGYPMLIRPTSTLFLQPKAVDGGAVLVVHVVDREGGSWLATYEVQRQADKSWRINGCVVSPDDKEEST